MGDRADRSPAGITHKSGKWRVRPNQVSGSINISRLNNINFEDKSSREGLQENDVFLAFKSLIISIIEKFERDRQTIMREMARFYDKKNETETKRKEAEKIANEVIRKTDKEYAGLDINTMKKSDNYQTRFLAERVLDFKKEKEELISELKLVRALASTGLVITSFAHELRNISANILPRSEDLMGILNDVIPEEVLNSLEDFNNPITIINELKEQDIRIKNWLDFSLNAIRKDKRRKKKLDLFQVFQEFSRTWASALSYQSVTLSVPNSDKEKLMYRVFLIDIDSIFNNLIANSIDAFLRSDATGVREILINCYQEGNKLYIDYEDSGPGLSNDIKDPDWIFESFNTTKKDAIGRDVGTGLGMWIVKSTIEEYKGEVLIENKRPGFKLTIMLPLRADEGIINYE
jgi:signal transduction histidine kinase